MGIHISFWHGSHDGLLGHFLSLPHAEIEAWLLQCMEQFPEEFDPAILALLQNFRRHGVEALKVDSAADAKLVDELLKVCYGQYCDQHIDRSMLQDASSSTLHLRRYDTITDALRRANAPPDILKLWHYLFTGRPLLRDPSLLPFNFNDDIYRIGYWTADEVLALQGWLQATIGADEHAKDAALVAMATAAERKQGLIMTMS